MIRYTLACRSGHEFESWFQNSSAYDAQVTRGLIVCPACGSSEVEKALMTPSLSRSVTTSKQRSAADPAPDPAAAPGSKAPVAIMWPQERELRTKLKELRDQLTKSAERVSLHRDRIFFKLRARTAANCRHLRHHREDPREVVHVRRQ